MTEKKIDVALKKLMKWKTSIIIAHRLSTIKHVDKIFVLENGRIIESWSYDDLIQQKWKFFNLANPDKLVLW
jgi:ATP-binding cassette subfamily B protein